MKTQYLPLDRWQKTRWNKIRKDLMPSFKLRKIWIIFILILKSRSQRYLLDGVEIKNFSQSAYSSKPRAASDTCTTFSPLFRWATLNLGACRHQSHPSRSLHYCPKIDSRNADIVHLRGCPFKIAIWIRRLSVLPALEKSSLLWILRPLRAISLPFAWKFMGVWYLQHTCDF